MPSFTSLADLVKAYESGTRGVPGTANYTARNPDSTASGAYQYLDSSWRQFAAAVGVDTSQYPTAASAPANIQDMVFQNTVQTVGLTPWTCPGCNPPLANALAADPSLAQLPVTAGGTQLTIPISDPNSFPGTGAEGLPPQAPPGGGVYPAIVGWWQSLWETLTRAGVFVLGMFLVLLALFAMLWQSKTVQVVVKTVATRAA